MAKKGELRTSYSNSFKIKTHDQLEFDLVNV